MSQRTGLTGHCRTKGRPGYSRCGLSRPAAASAAHRSPSSSTLILFTLTQPHRRQEGNSTVLVRDPGRDPALGGFAEVGTWSTMGGKGKGCEITEGELSMYFLILSSRVSRDTVSLPFPPVTRPRRAGVIRFWVCLT